MGLAVVLIILRESCLSLESAPLATVKVASLSKTVCVVTAGVASLPETVCIATAGPLAEVVSEIVHAK